MKCKCKLEIVVVERHADCEVHKRDAGEQCCVCGRMVEVEEVDSGTNTPGTVIRLPGGARIFTFDGWLYCSEGCLRQGMGIKDEDQAELEKPEKAFQPIVRAPEPTTE